MHPIDLATLVRRLDPHAGRIPVVLDTDTYNEIDDQFALAYAELSPDAIDLQAVYAAPFYNDRSDSPGNGMLKSYEEILRVYDRLGREPGGKVFKGSDAFLKDEQTPVHSAACQDLIQRAMSRAEDDGPLYVAAIGAITNVASAILAEPRIIDRIVVVWLGGHPHTWHSAHEFNLAGDPSAVRVVLGSGVPLITMPCRAVAEKLLTTRAEIAHTLAGRGPISQYLHDIFLEYNPDVLAHSKVIWDIGVIGYLVNPDWAPTSLIPSPLLSEKLTWSKDDRRHPIREVYDVNRDAIFADMFTKLLNTSAGE